MVRLIIVFLLGLCVSGGLLARSNVEITGMGYFKSRNISARLSFLNDVVTKDVLDVAVLEDCAFLILEQMKREGYLRPAVEGRFTAEGVETTARWESDYSVQLPANFTAEHAVFELIPGAVFFYEAVEVQGVSALPPEQLDRYFIAQGALYHRATSRVFTPANFARRAGRVIRALEDLGYRSARIEHMDTEMDEVTGAVQAELVIEQGPLHRVGRAQAVLVDASGAVEKERVFEQAGMLYTRNWERDQSNRLRNEAYGLGYPDVRVTVEVGDGVANAAGEREHAIRFKVVLGTHVTLTGVRFEGAEEMQSSVLYQRIDMATGEPLSVVKVREARRRLMGIGVFREVDVSYDPETGPERDVVYRLEPGLRKELRLLGGWGSYEQARVGINWEQRNPWGRGHRYTIGVKESVKTSEADARYAVPQIFSSDMTGYVHAEHRFREEISYDYTTRSVAVGASTFLAKPGVLLTAEYGLADEDADRDDNVSFESNDSAIVTSLTLRASFDRQDHFLYPSAGYHLFGEYQIASEWLGGDVDFQKLEGGLSYHHPLTQSLVLHFGARAGAIVASGDSSEEIPFVERFFLGGENTLRGYREGQASPLDAHGKEIGAEGYLLTNVELEQRVFTDLSLVLFYDGVSVARDDVFDESEFLYSIGIGARYRTVVGPIRLEYGHNPDPRKGDPDGTLHFSMGFPF
jgi:outer membrane protein assembly factor BamA